MQKSAHQPIKFRGQTDRQQAGDTARLFRYSTLQGRQNPKDCDLGIWTTYKTASIELYRTPEPSSNSATRRRTTEIQELRWEQFL
jgi:hypothetical protein